MNPIAAFLALALAADAPATAPPAAPPAADPPPPAAEAPPFAAGEQIDFTVDYLGVGIGSLRLWVGRAEGAVLPLFLQTRTKGLAAIVDVREQIATSWDAETRLPRSSRLDALEMSYWHSDTTRFDRAAGKATVSVRNQHGVVETVVDVPPETLDFLSMVYVLRTRPLAVGGRHEFQVLAGKKVSPVVAEVVGREVVQGAGRRVPAFKVRVPTGFTGRFSEKDPTYVWFADEPGRVPVRISTDFAVGRAVASITSYRPR